MLRNCKLLVVLSVILCVTANQAYAQSRTIPDPTEETGGGTEGGTTTDGGTTDDGATGGVDIDSDEELLGDVKTEIQVLPWTQIAIDEAVPLKDDLIREADVFWYKILWRVIDCREKVNRPLVAPKMPLITILLDAATSGGVTLYDGLDDEFTTPVDLGTIPALSSQSDSVWVYNPVTEMDELTVIRQEFNPDAVNKFRIKEIWFFNEETSTMESRILGIAPIMEKYGELGNYQGDVVLFWAYFPELRETLVKKQAYNPLSGGIPLTFDHLFTLRLFSSYVIKEDNVEDLRIQDYSTGINALYESEKIKEDLFNFEHDLWSY